MHCITDPRQQREASRALRRISIIHRHGLKEGVDRRAECRKRRHGALEILRRDSLCRTGFRHVERSDKGSFGDFGRDLAAHMGSAFSLEPLLTQSAWFRAHNRDDVIPNLYLVGAGTHPGAGIPGVVGSAKATAALMLEEVK